VTNGAALTSTDGPGAYLPALTSTDGPGAHLPGMLQLIHVYETESGIALFLPRVGVKDVDMNRA